jgi:hypothetical protein
MSMKHRPLFLSRVLRTVRQSAGFLLVATALPGTAAAAVGPEIDPGSASSALVLLQGGMLLLADKIRNR